MFDEKTEGQTYHADDATLAYIAKLEEELAAMKKAAVEPVAWLIPGTSIEGACAFINEEAARYCASTQFGGTVTPLYAATPDTERQLAEAHEKVLRVVRGEFTQICSYCGWEAPTGGASWEELQVHICSCKEHPVFRLNKQLAEAIAREEKLREAINEVFPQFKVIHLI